MTKQKLLLKKAKWEERLVALHRWSIFKKVVFFMRYMDLKHLCEAYIETCEEHLQNGKYYDK